MAAKGEARSYQQEEPSPAVELLGPWECCGLFCELRRQVPFWAMIVL